ncbi:MAG: 2-keto-4-pentenoate hydratase [Rubripirellula sp.]
MIHNNDPPISHWANRQLADYDARQPGSIFAEGAELTLEQGYAVQTAVTELRMRRGEQVIGYKVGCTSDKIRTQLGIQHCVSGRLFSSEQHPSGAVLKRSTFARLAIEGELAVELSRSPTVNDLDAVGVPACVSRVFPVIELHHLVMHGLRPTAGELVANNALQAGVVTSQGGMSAAPRATELKIFIDDRLVDQCAGKVIVQTIQSSLRWLHGIMQDRGETLRRGQIILTGSVPSLIPIDQNCCVRVDAASLGVVEALFTT